MAHQPENPQDQPDKKYKPKSDRYRKVVGALAGLVAPLAHAPAVFAGNQAPLAHEAVATATKPQLPHQLVAKYLEILGAAKLSKSDAQAFDESITTYLHADECLNARIFIPLHHKLSDNYLFRNSPYEPKAGTPRKDLPSSSYYSAKAINPSEIMGIDPMTAQDIPPEDLYLELTCPMFAKVNGQEWLFFDDWRGSGGAESINNRKVDPKVYITLFDNLTWIKPQDLDKIPGVKIEVIDKSKPPIIKGHYATGGQAVGPTLHFPGVEDNQYFTIGLQPKNSVYLAKEFQIPNVTKFIGHSG